MMSNSLSTNQVDNKPKNGQRFGWHNLKSYWWLMLINGLVFFFLGPVGTMLFMKQADFSQAAHVQLAKKWLIFDGLTSTYVVAFIMAAIMAVIMFSYLHSKNQVNFYHSMPITRRTLFGQNYLTGIVIALLPLAVMMLLTFVAVSIAGGWGIIAPGAWLAHFGRITLFYVLSYSLSVLATQLTGTILTSILMVLFLHVALIATVGCAFWSLSTFWTTYDLRGIEVWLFKLAPFTYLMEYIGQQGRCYGNFNHVGDRIVSEGIMPVVGLGVVAILVMLLLTVVLTALALYLYSKRPSEAAGEPLVYGWSKPPLKGVAQFVAGIGGGVLFLELGESLGFFIFGLVSGVVLTHMVAEVVIHKDFKAMTKHWRGCLAYVVVLMLFCGSLYYDIWGYERYLPERSQVQKIAIGFDGMQESREVYWDDDQSIACFTEPAQLDAILEITGEVVRDKNYWRNEAIYGDDGVTNSRYKTNYLSVTYYLDGGKVVTRSYDATIAQRYQDAFAKLYNSQEYKRVNQRGTMALTTEKMREITVRPIDNVSGAYTSRTPSQDDYSRELLAALQQDLAERQFTTIQKAPSYVMECEISVDEWNDGRSVASTTELIYPDDQRTLAVIDRLIKDNKMQGVNMGAIAENLLTLSLYETAPELANADAQTFAQTTGDSTSALLEKGQIKLVETFSEQAQIADILSNGTIMDEQLRAATPYLRLDQHYILLGQIKEDAVEWSSAKDYPVRNEDGALFIRFYRMLP